jgi:hypothetical protein
VMRDSSTRGVFPIASTTLGSIFPPAKGMGMRYAGVFLQAGSRLPCACSRYNDNSLLTKSKWKIVIENEKNTTYRFTDLETDERPREPLEKLGAQALSSAELLVILLRVGVKEENADQMGSRLLHEFSSLGGLQSASFAEV